MPIAITRGLTTKTSRVHSGISGVGDRDGNVSIGLGLDQSMPWARNMRSRISRMIGCLRRL